MPSAQVINFGEDPYANAMGGFARNFLSTINEKTAQRRNDDLFKRIADQYGEDVSTERIIRDVIKAEGFDQDYKRNKLKELTDYATLGAKRDRNGYENAKLEQRREELEVRKKTNEIAENRLNNEANRIQATAEKNKGTTSKQINDYASKVLKDASVNLPAHDRADLTNFMDQLVNDPENPMTIPQAYKQAANYIDARREKIDTVKIAERPGYWSGTPIVTAMQQAITDLQALHDEDGIDNQKELRTIAKRSSWKDEEITAMLQRVFASNGKKLRGPAPKSAQESAKIPLEIQGQTAQAASVDDILFGE